MQTLFIMYTDYLQLSYSPFTDLNYDIVRGIRENIEDGRHEG